MLLPETAIARAAGVDRCAVVSVQSVLCGSALLKETITPSLFRDSSLHIYLSGDHRRKQYHVGRIGTDQSEPKLDLFKFAIHLCLFSAALQCSQSDTAVAIQRKERIRDHSNRQCRK
jgi:hypothetical protein